MPDGTSADNAPILLREDSDGVAVLTLNRPKSLNALSMGLLAALQGTLEKIKADRSVKVVIVAANGAAFCAGHDLKEIRANPGQQHYEALFEACSKVMQTIQRLPQPVIAQIHASAYAAGCQLVATSDLAVAGESATFCTPGVNIGLFCSTPMVATTRNLGRKQAMEMLLTGEAISARKAAEWGLVNRVVPDEKLAESTMELARRIAEKSPLTVAIGKVAFYRQIEMPLEQAYDYASRVMTENMLARDAEEGIDAFLQKRPPVWEGR